MPCEAEQKDLDTAIAEVSDFAKQQAKELAARAEQQTRGIGADIEDDADLAGVLGGIAGGAYGGVEGAVAGSVIGREIGKIFVIDI